MPEDWPQVIVHADMDAFYASVKQRDNPELKNIPVLVGPKSHRGVVLAASYEARRFGVTSAMPMGEARRRCPTAVIVSPRISRYQEVSSQVMTIFADFSPWVEAISLDEAFLNMSGAAHFFGPPAEMGQRLKTAVLQSTQLNISVGISGTKYVAKIASAHDKPDGLTIIAPGQAKQWLAPRPIRRLWGVGKKTEARFHGLGIRTIGELAATDKNSLRHHLGHTGTHFHNLANGIDPRPVKRSRVARSMGSDRTLAVDVHRSGEIERHLLRSAERLGRRLRRKQLLAGGVRIRLKTTRFKLISSQQLIGTPSASSEVLISVARRLLTRLTDSTTNADPSRIGPFRLVGMAVFALQRQNEPSQLDLFSNASGNTLDITLDQLNEKYGKDVVFRGSDMSNPGMISSNGANLDLIVPEDE